jgi:hypothetical protein
MQQDIAQIFRDVKISAHKIRARLKYRSHGKIQANIKKFSYWARYPYLRLLVVLVISFFNFSVFIEDPTLYSQVEVYIPVAGHILLLMAARWPPVCLFFIITTPLLTDSQLCGVLSSLVSFCSRSWWD